MDLLNRPGSEKTGENPKIGPAINREHYLPFLCVLGQKQRVIRKENLRHGKHRLVPQVDVPEEWKKARAPVPAR